MTSPEPSPHETGAKLLALFASLPEYDQGMALCAMTTYAYRGQGGVHTNAIVETDDRPLVAFAVAMEPVLAQQLLDAVRPLTKDEPALERRSVALGRRLFAFESQEHWVDNAKDWFAECGVPGFQTVCIDARGRICTCGLHFQQATRDGAYPVTVYALAGAEPDGREEA